MEDTFGTHPINDEDQRMFMRAIRPSFMTAEDEDVLAEQARSDAAYTEAVRKGIEALPGIIPDASFVNADGSSLYSDEEDDGPQGGFAFAALAPVLGAIAPSLINSGFKLLSSLFKKRANGTGISAPNARGVRAPNFFAKGGRKAFIASIAPRLYQEEEIVRQFRGKKFWHEMFKMARKYLREAIDQAGLDKKTTQAVMNKLVPLSFQKFVAKVGREAPIAEVADPDAPEAAEGSGEKNETNQLRSIVRAVCEWVINEATDGKVNAARVRPLIDQKLARLDKRTMKVQGGSKAGWNNFWTKVKKFASRVGKAVLPGLAEVTKKAAPGVIKQILSGITVSDKNKPWLEIANSLADSAGSLIPSSQTSGTGMSAEYMNPPPGKPAKKPRTPAQIAATKRMLAANAARRAAAASADEPFVSGVPAPKASGRKKVVRLTF